MTNTLVYNGILRGLENHEREFVIAGEFTKDDVEKAKRILKDNYFKADVNLIGHMISVSNVR